MFQVGHGVFYQDLLNLLLLPLTIGEETPRVTNTLEFVAKFIVSLNDRQNDEDNPVLQKMYDFLTSKTDARNVNVRYRICQLLQMILTSLGDEAIIDDNLYEKISSAMLSCMKDKSPKVRVQAVLALHRLQNPSSNTCPVIETYLFHVTRDPNADVRRTILSKIGKSKKILRIALEKIFDVNVRVRIEAYKFISKITVRSLTIQQRETVLKKGLKDSSNHVVTCIRKILLPTWLKHYNYSYIDLLKGLDPENALEFTIQAIDSLLKYVHTLESCINFYIQI